VSLKRCSPSWNWSVRAASTCGRRTQRPLTVLGWSAAHPLAARKTRTCRGSQNGSPSRAIAQTPRAHTRELVHERVQARVDRDVREIAEADGEQAVSVRARVAPTAEQRGAAQQQLTEVHGLLLMELIADRRGRERSAEEVAQDAEREAIEIREIDQDRAEAQHGEAIAFVGASRATQRDASARERVVERGEVDGFGWHAATCWRS